MSKSSVISRLIRVDLTFPEKFSFELPRGLLLVGESWSSSACRSETLGQLRFFLLVLPWQFAGGLCMLSEAFASSFLMSESSGESSLILKDSCRDSSLILKGVFRSSSCIVALLGFFKSCYLIGWFKYANLSSFSNAFYLGVPSSDNIPFGLAKD